MGYTHDDLLKLYDISGIPPEKSAPFFGVELPPPPPVAPVAPIDRGDLLAGNEKKPGEGVADWRSMDLSNVPMPTNPAPSKGPVGTHAAVPMGGLAETTGSMIPFGPAAVPTSQPAQKKPATDAKPDDGMAASQALEMAATGGAPVARSAGIAMPSRDKAHKDARRMTGEESRTAYAVDDKDEAARAALIDAKRAEAAAIAAPAIEYAMAKRDIQDLGQQMEANQALRARANQDAEARIDAEMAAARKGMQKTEGDKVATGIAYALAVIGQGLQAAGGQNVDYVSQVAKIQTDAADREYAKSLDVIKNLRVSQAKKDELMDRANATLLAKRQNLLDGMNMGLERLKATNGGKESEAQARAFDLATQAVASDSKAKRATLVKNVEDRIYDERMAAAAAAAQPRLAFTPQQVKKFEEYRSLAIPLGGTRVALARSKEDKAKVNELVSATANVNAMAKRYIEATKALSQAQGAGEQAKNVAGMSKLINDQKNAAKQLELAAAHPLLGTIGQGDKETAKELVSLVRNPWTETGTEMAISAANQLMKGADMVKAEGMRNFTSGEAEEIMAPDGTMMAVPLSMTGNAGSAAGPQLSKTR